MLSRMTTRFAGLVYPPAAIAQVVRRRIGYVVLHDPVWSFRIERDRFLEGGPDKATYREGRETPPATVGDEGSSVNDSAHARRRVQTPDKRDDRDTKRHPSRPPNCLAGRIPHHAPPVRGEDAPFKSRKQTVTAFRGGG